MAGTSLAAEHRKLLARAVLNARRESEAGARESLRALAVDHHEPFGHMNADARKLRNALRAHGRQLGDALDPKRGTQAIERLTHEVAFEHWHRMLFARFLAENGLLMHPTMGASVTLEECQELAREAGKDPWELAASFAQASLPQIFRQDDPALRVSLPANTRTVLERVVSGLPVEVFHASDALGWLYQFWQSEAKAAVNDADGPVGPDGIAAVTQLFTERYMVEFLLHNTLGAWHAGKVLLANPELARRAESEEELRSAAAIDGCDWKYLRFVRKPGETESGEWVVAAGSFPHWPREARNITFLEPCLGSGHIFVCALEMFVALRRHEEGLSREEAVCAVLRDNLFGLELELRCTQIGVFAVAMHAWRSIGRRCDLPPIQIACCGLSVGGTREAWLRHAGADARLANGLGALYDLFEHAPLLGSLIDPKKSLDATVLAAGFDEIRPALESLLSRSADDQQHEAGVAAAGMLDAVRLLSRSYTLIVTNPPYLGRGKQDAPMKEYADAHLADAKHDLATMFLSRALRWAGSMGTVAMVMPQNWLFLKSYKKLRERLLKRHSFDVVARLGPGAFEEISGEVVQAALIAVSVSTALDDHRFLGIDVSQQRGERSNPAQEKAAALQSGGVESLPQRVPRTDADFCIQSHVRNGDIPTLEQFADVYQGVGTTDNPRYLLTFWEVATVSEAWEYFQYSPEFDGGFSGLSGILRWERGNGPLSAIGTAHKGLRAYGKRGFAVSVTSGQKFTHFLGYRFDNTIAVLLAKKPEHHCAIGAFLSSSEFKSEVRRLDPSLSVTESSFLKVPIDIVHWESLAAERHPAGLPKPSACNPTQWLFDGHPAGSDQLLHVAVARLLGYQWPRQTGSSFPDCPAIGWDGLEEHTDDDGIVPINPMRGEPAASERLLSLLRDAYTSKGETFDLSVASKQLAEAGANATDLGEWLLNEFFERHCKLFHNRPFVWHIWDGRKDGFNVLVNYHRLAAPGGAGRQLLEKITYDYLKDWIDRQNAGVKNGDAGAEARLAAATKLQKELIKIIEGEAPYDIFVRWKPLSAQAIGWSPDINDGVRMNIRPFMLAEDMGKKGAGLLRSKPNIKWDKDRGKEPERAKTDFPWFWSCDPDSNPSHTTDFAGGRECTGERWNDLHYTLAVKTAAKSRAAKEKK